MSNVSGSTIGGVVGAIVGFYFGNPQLGWMIGSAIGGYVDPDVIKQQGPRLSDATSQTARDGVPIPIIYGTAPIMGNIIWRAPLVENVITTSERQGKGGPVVKTTTYQYTRSYAIGICEGPIEGLLIVKENGAIVYDQRTDEELTAIGYSTEQIATTRAASATWMASGVGFYPGTEDQPPDLTIEAHEGVGNVVPFRGLAYLVRLNHDLTDFRGAIPQYEFVVVSEGTSAAGFGTPQWAATSGAQFGRTDDATAWAETTTALTGDKDGTSLMYGDGILVKYRGTGNLAYSNDRGETWNSPSDPRSAQAAGTVLGRYVAGQFRLCATDGQVKQLSSSADGDHWSDQWIDPASGQLTTVGGHDGLMLVGDNVGGVCRSTDAGGSWAGPVNPTGSPISDMATDGTLIVLVAGSNRIRSTTDGISFTVVTSPFASGDINLIRYSDGLGLWVAATATAVAYSSDGSSWTLGTTPAGMTIRSLDANDSTFVMVGEIANDTAIYTSTNGSTWSIASEVFPALGDGLFDVVAMPCDGTPLPGAPGFYVHDDGTICGPAGGTLARSQVVLGTIVADICQRRGLTEDQYDVSDLTDVLDGYRIATQGSGDSFIAPLMAAYFFDAGEWDGKLRFVKRGGPTMLSLTMDDLAEREGDAIEQERVQEAELLRKNTISYLDPAASFTITTQQWERRAGTVQAKGEMSIEVPVVDDGTSMAQVAEKRGKIAWSETEKYKFSLPVRLSKITPTDVITLTDAQSVSHRMRVMRMEEDSGVLLCEAVRDKQPAYIGTVTGTAPTTPPGQTPPPVRGPTKAMAFNGPPPTISDDAKAGIWIAACGLLPGWIGFDLYISADDGDTYPYIGRYENSARMGWLRSAITSSSATIPVQLYGSAEIESVTDEQLDANQNVWVIKTGENAEFGQSQTATPNGTGFDLTDNERGLLSPDTETSHNANDPFALLDQAIYVPVDTRFAGKELRIVAASVGTNFEDNPYITLVYDPPEIVWDGNGDDDEGEDGPDPDPGGAGTPGTPTARTIGATVSTPSLTAGEANATANSAAINAAFAGLPGGGGIVRLPAGTYYIDTANPIEPVSNSRLDLDTNNTILRAKGSNTTTAPATHRDICRIDGVHDVEIVGGQFIGYRDYWKANGGVASFGVSEWAHGIYVTGGSYNVTIYDTTFDKFVGDGISVGRSSQNVHVLNIKSTNNRRQGISAAGVSSSANIKLENCECAYIGVGDGTAPRAGIDCEVDEPATHSVSGVTITGCYLHHNAGPGLICYKSVNNLTITNNRIEYNVRGIYAVDSDNVDLHDNTIRYNGLEAVSLLGTSSNWDIDGNTFYGNKTRQYGTPSSGLDTTTSPTSTQKGKHITVANTVTGTTYGTNTYGPV